MTAVALQPGDLGLYYLGERVGEVQVPDHRLNPGFNQRILDIRLYEHGDGMLDLLAKDMLESTTRTSLGLKGTIVVDTLVPIELEIDRELSLDGIGELSVVIDDIAVETLDDGIAVAIEATVDNPSRVEVALELLEFDILYEGLLVDTVSAKGMLFTGVNSIQVDLFIPSDAGQVYNSLAAALIDGRDCLFQVRGHDPGGAGGADGAGGGAGGEGSAGDTGDTGGGTLLAGLSTAFHYDYLLQVSKRIGLSVSSIEITSIGLFYSTVSVTALVDNPGVVTADISRFHLDVYQQGELIGQGFLPEATIVPGLQTLRLDLTVTTLSLDTLGLFGQLVLGSQVDLVIEAHREFDADHSLRLSLAVTLDEGISIL